MLRLVVQGASNGEIADDLVITEGTVQSHVSNILSRLEARDRNYAGVSYRG
ncbi:MAG: helix-turn-helix transcriptional regulator [Chloroflexi bacterium]|nr:helix-turn-helix transcriptional regulator [Chloroflexota bacterium]